MIVQLADPAEANGDNTISTDKKEEAENDSLSLLGKEEKTLVDDQVSNEKTRLRQEEETRRSSEKVVDVVDYEDDDEFW